MAWRYALATALLASPCFAWQTPDGLYFTGAGADALIADGTVRAEGAGFACVGCHGADGRGNGEGATRIPPVTWTVLTAPTGERPAYDAESLAEAIRSGLRPDGTPLSSAMPRYEMDEAAMAGLIESLRYLEANDRRAFGPREIEVTANPDDPRLTGFAAATRRFNEAGGAYGRRILLVDSGNGISLGDIFDAMREDLAETAEARLFERISADGHLRIRWQTRLPPAERDFRLRQRGLVHDETARILLWTDPGETPPTSVALDAVYADLAVAAPALGSLIERSIPIYLAAPDADVLDAARRDPAPLAYVEGYLAGLALGEALVEAGRAGGQEALRRSLTGSGSRLPISVHRIGG